MEEEIDPSKEFIDAFNLGYDLALISPAIADIFVGLKPDSQVINGLKSGIKEFGRVADLGREQNPSRMPDWLTRDRFEEDKVIITKENVDKDKGIEPNIQDY